jgi:hypothetical protein
LPADVTARDFAKNVLAKVPNNLDEHLSVEDIAALIRVSDSTSDHGPAAARSLPTVS